MTVTIKPAELDAQIAQLAWLHAEFDARAEFTLLRLETLDKLAHLLPTDDAFDAAYAIWDDYIDGRRADERGEALTSQQLSEQASMFALVSRYLSPNAMLALAHAAWGSKSFEVRTRNFSGHVTGKLGWYRGDTLTIRDIAASVPNVTSVWREQGKLKSEHYHLTTRQAAHAVALHPVFGRADS